MDKRPMEDIFNDCYEKLLSGMSVEDIVRQYPQHAKEITELLTMAKKMEKSSSVEVNDRALVSCLIKVGEAIQEKKERSFGAVIQRLFFIPSMTFARGFAITVLVLFVAWGSVNASANSVPGEPLYLVKLISERVKYFLTVNPEGQVELKIVFSEGRSKELLSKFNKDGRIDIKTMQSMLKEAQTSFDLVSKLPTQQQELYLARLQYLNNYQKEVLNNLRDKSPEDQKSAVDEAICMCDQHDKLLQKVRNNGICSKCKTEQKGCKCKK